jgi:GNAT superfamily N-acetyltransferase
MTVHVIPLSDPDRSAASYRLAWLAGGADGRPLASAFLRVPAVGDVAELELVVHPAERRAGVGTRLLGAAEAAAGELGMHAIVTEPIREGGEGELFCRARGLRAVLTLTYARLELDGTVPQAQPVAGYRLIHWEGTVPDDLAGTFARSRRAMDDMPMDEAASAPQPWDVPRLHAVAAAVARRGDILHTTAACGPDGEIVAFTELVVPGSQAGEAQHYGTGVLPEHRGHGLAQWMKAEQIALIRTRFPAVTALLADTAESNTPMRRINDALGYRPTHRRLVFQRDLKPSATT